MALDASIRQGRFTPSGLLQNETVDQLELQLLLSFQSHDKKGEFSPKSWSTEHHLRVFFHRYEQSLS